MLNLASIASPAISKLPLPDLNASLGKLTETFDPSAMVGQVSGNMASQQAAIEAMRSQLDAVRQQSQMQMANTDLASLQKYTAGLSASADTACVMASTKPAFVPMTPDSLSNPLATDILGSATGQLTGKLLSESLLGNTDLLMAVGDAAGLSPGMTAALSGDMSRLTTSEGLTDLACMGAGVYLSGLTGGVIPPSMCSSVVKNVAGNTVNGVISSTMKGDPASALGAASNINPAIDTGVLSSAITSDSTGMLTEGLVSSVVNSTLNQVGGSGLQRVGSDVLHNISTGIQTSINRDGYTGTIGGVNLGNADAIYDSLIYNGLQVAASNGDVDGLCGYAAMMYGNQPNGIISKVVTAAAPAVTQTPGFVEKYTALQQSLEPPKDPFISYNTSSDTTVSPDKTYYTKHPNGSYVKVDLKPGDPISKDVFFEKKTDIESIPTRTVSFVGNALLKAGGPIANTVLGVADAKMQSKMREIANDHNSSTAERIFSTALAYA